MANSNISTKHADLNLEINDTWLTVVICVWCLGTLAMLTFKVLVFRLMYKKGPLIDNPINVLILFDELGWFLQLIFIPQMFYILHVKNTEELHGQKGCLFLHAYVLLAVFSIFQFLFGGLAIACLRFIYIRAHWILHVFGRWPVTLLILASSQFLMFWLTFLYVYDKDRIWDIDFCWKGLDKMRVYEPSSNIILFFLVSGCSLELAIHLYLSYYLYQSDKQVRHMIPSESYKRRKMKTAVDLAGQMLRFVFELLILAICAIGGQNPHPESKFAVIMASGIIPILGLGILPVYHIYMSATLRQELYTVVAPLSCRWKKGFMDAVKKATHRTGPETMELPSLGTLHQR